MYADEKADDRRYIMCPTFKSFLNPEQCKKNKSVSMLGKFGGSDKQNNIDPKCFAFTVRNFEMEMKV